MSSLKADGKKLKKVWNAAKKLFFFNSAEWIRVRSNSNFISLVPTPQFLANTSATTRNFFNAFTLDTPINGRIITRGEIPNLNADGPFAALSSNLPVFGEVISSMPANAGGGLPQNDVQTIGRIDWNLSDKSQLYGRYALQDQTLFDGTNAFSPYSGFNTGQTNFNNNFLLSLTHTFSPQWVSQSKVAFNRLNNKQPLGEAPLSCGARLNLQYSNLNTRGNLGFSNYNGLTFGYETSFSGEFFNLFNHSNLYLVGTQTDISGNDFIPAARGLRADATQDRRNVQLALKFIF